MRKCCYMVIPNINHKLSYEMKIEQIILYIKYRILLEIISLLTIGKKDNDKRVYANWDILLIIPHDNLINSSSKEIY